MCSKCDQIDSRIARYKQLMTGIIDQQVQDAADRMVARLEAEKQALHPKE